MLAVADTSPLHYLVLIQHEAILPALYERVAIPPAVLADLQQSRTPHLVRAWVTSPVVFQLCGFLKIALVGYRL
jgi:predicted nucleic acid-binding protein